MKNFLKVFLGLYLGASIAQADSVMLSKVNQANAIIKETLSEFNNAERSCSLVLKALKTQGGKTRKFDVAFDLSLYQATSYKAPNAQTFNMNVEFDYKNPKNKYKSPSGGIALKSTLNLLALMDQERLNSAPKDIQDMIEGEASQYGNAIKITYNKYEVLYEELSDLQKAFNERLGINPDTKNVSSLIFDASVTIDPTLLSQAQKDKLMVTELNFKGRIDRDHLDLSIDYVANPGTSFFNADKEGIKEWVEKVLARDPSTLQNLKNAAAIAAQFAERLQKNLPFNPQMPKQ